jgi:hypothetical protein
MVLSIVCAVEITAEQHNERSPICFETVLIFSGDRLDFPLRLGSYPVCSTSTAGPFQHRQMLDFS